MQNAGHSNASILKIPKLNGSNYHEWKNNIHLILVLRDLWFLMHDERPLAEQEDKLKAWKRVQEHTRAIIHLTYESDQAHLMSHAATGQEAWGIFSDTYASSDVSNVMELEERFGAAKKTTGMSMSQWFGHIRDLASRLRQHHHRKE